LPASRKREFVGRTELREFRHFFILQIRAMPELVKLVPPYNFDKFNGLLKPILPGLLADRNREVRP